MDSQVHPAAKACEPKLDPNVDLVRCRGAQGKCPRPATYGLDRPNGRSTASLLRGGRRYLVWNGYRVSDHYDTTLEFSLMSQAGMKYKQILASLTTKPARKFGDSDHTGRIAKDMKADLVILNADPAQDVTAYSKVRFTIRNGKVLYKER